MIVLACALVAALLVALGLVAWLVITRVSAADGEADARVAQTAMESELERTQFELAQTKVALSSSERRAGILEQAIAEALNAAPNADLGRNDVLGRVVRITAEWAKADREGRLPSDADPAVPEESSAESPGPVVRPGDTELPGA